MSSKTDSAVKLAIVFFISLLSFSVGTFVGKKFSDNQHQLAALEPQQSEKRSVASVETQKPSTAHKESSAVMTDDEIARLADEFVTDDITPVPHNTQPAATHGINETSGNAATNTHTVRADDPSAAAKNLAHSGTPAGVQPIAAKPGSPADDQRLPSSLPKNVAAYSVGKFTVQVASYADESEAQKMAGDLKSKGYSAFYIPASIKGKTWYRVSVGQFSTQKEAQEYRGTLLEKAKVESAIVQKITE